VKFFTYKKHGYLRWFRNTSRYEFVTPGRHEHGNPIDAEDGEFRPLLRVWNGSVPETAEGRETGTFPAVIDGIALDVAG
jgi:hypothetical protein